MEKKIEQIESDIGKLSEHQKLHKEAFQTLYMKAQKY